MLDSTFFFLASSSALFLASSSSFLCLSSCGKEKSVFSSLSVPAFHRSAVRRHPSSLWTGGGDLAAYAAQRQNASNHRDACLPVALFLCPHALLLCPLGAAALLRQEVAHSFSAGSEEIHQVVQRSTGCFVSEAATELPRSSVAFCLIHFS